MRGKWNVYLILCFLAVEALATTSFGANVTYDHRAIVIDGHRRTLISGSIHYPRSTPDMWPGLIRKAKEGGLDVIETYVFWNLHEPVRYQYDFAGQKDLVHFIKLVAEAGLYAFIRIGPYICSEWNFGGLPVWLRFLPHVEFRTNNETFKAEMQRFTTLIVNMMKKENLFASQGGPIILSQIENEYGYVQSDFGAGGKSYIEWAANMANSLGTGVPWIMCQQKDAPDPMINTCNGYYCDQNFTPNAPNKPKIWTECWSGWNTYWGKAVPYRPVEDLAFGVARFFQRGGTMSNYYMYHGGTNFGRTSGGPFIPTSYDYGAPIDEYGLVNQPTWGHLKDLHKAIKLCEQAIVATYPVITSLGTNLEAGVYKTNSGLCAAFLANVNVQSDTYVTFNNNTYHLPAWSVSILPDCKNVVFNTAKVNSVSAKAKFIAPFSDKNNLYAFKAFETWSWFYEPVGVSSCKSVPQHKLLEQISTTFDKSDYFWYSVSINIEGNEPFLQNASQTTLHVESNGHALLVFVNWKLTGSGKGSNRNLKFSIDVPITLAKGSNRIDLLSYTVGLQNYGAHFETWPAGLVGPVKLNGANNGGSLDLTTEPWTNQIGLKGEGLGFCIGASPETDQKNGKEGSSIWLSGQALPKNLPLTWYTATFDAPNDTNPVALDLTGMGKGMVWINGQSIGRYWQNYIVPDAGCTDKCDYRGVYNPQKCLTNCAKATQQFYHVPRSWLTQRDNILIIFEEMGGDPTQIYIATRQIDSVCAFVSEDYPQPVDMWNTQQKKEHKIEAKLSLECPSPNQVISSINFASFGNPQGTCGSFSHGSCSSTTAPSIVTKACYGKKSCSIGVSVATFGDPCNGAVKSLAVEATCK